MEPNPKGLCTQTAAGESDHLQQKKPLARDKDGLTFLHYLAQGLTGALENVENHFLAEYKERINM